jgi:hypothetical protein
MRENHICRLESITNKHDSHISKHDADTHSIANSLE